MVWVLGWQSLGGAGGLRWHLVAGAASHAITRHPLSQGSESRAIRRHRFLSLHPTAIREEPAARKWPGLRREWPGRQRDPQAASKAVASSYRCGNLAGRAPGRPRRRGPQPTAAAAAVSAGGHRARRAGAWVHSPPDPARPGNKPEPIRNPRRRALFRVFPPPVGAGPSGLRPPAPPEPAAAADGGGRGGHGGASAARLVGAGGGLGKGGWV